MLRQVFLLYLYNVLKNLFGMKKTLILAAAALLFFSCRNAEEEKVLQYYATPNPYEIVSVQEPAQDAEIRNIILPLWPLLEQKRPA